MLDFFLDSGDTELFIRRNSMACRLVKAGCLALGNGKQLERCIKQQSEAPPILFIFYINCLGNYYIHFYS